MEVLLCAGQGASKNDSQNNLSERGEDEQTRAKRDTDYHLSKRPALVSLYFLNLSH